MGVVLFWGKLPEFMPSQSGGGIFKHMAASGWSFAVPCCQNSSSLRCFENASWHLVSIRLFFPFILHWGSHRGITMGAGRRGY